MQDPAITIPVLASLDIAETERFYRDQLGFSVHTFGNYAIARRDRMEIHFWLASDRIHPEHTSCYIRGGQIVALYEEYLAKGIERLSETMRFGCRWTLDRYTTTIHAVANRAAGPHRLEA